MYFSKGLTMSRRVLALLFLLLYAGFHAKPEALQQSSVGVFQFVASSIDIVGLEDEVAYIVRNELRKSPNIIMMNQRDLESTVARNDIIQNFSVQSAVDAASVMNLNYVIIGKVARQGQIIVATLEVVSPVSAASIGQLTFYFNNQAQIALQAEAIGNDILTVIDEHSAQVKEAGGQFEELWLQELTASYANGAVRLSWSLSNQNEDVLGFNIYRADNEAGPFSYVASETELQLLDNTGSEPGTYYYQISLINSDGEEIRSSKVADVSIFAESKSDLQAPTIVSVNSKVGSASFEFFPSSENIGKPIVGYELLRREAGTEWAIVGRTKIDLSKNTNNSSATPNIEKLSIEDLSNRRAAGTVEYAIRAYTTKEKGQLTSSQSFTPAVAPQLTLASNQQVREISLSWTPVTAGFGYKIYRMDQTGSDKDWSLLEDIKGVAQTTFTDKSITEDGAQFQYAISVYDDVSETPLSEPLVVNSKAPLAPPGEVSTESGLARKAVISWQKSNDPAVVGYSIFRAPFTSDDELTLTRVGEVRDPSVISFTDNSGLEDGKSYYYSVASLNRFDSSGPLSKAVKVSTKEAPISPENVTASYLDGQVNLTWVLAENTVKEELESIQITKSYNGGKPQTLARLKPDDSSFTDNTLIAGAEVKYFVSLEDKDSLRSKSVASNMVNVDLKPVVKVSKQNMLRSMALEFDGAPQPAEIVLLRGESQDKLSPLTRLSIDSDNTYLDKEGLLDDKQYFYQIEVQLGGLTLSRSEIVSGLTKDIPAPSNLIAVSGLPRKIELSWDKVDDESIKGYVIFRKLASSDDALIKIAEISNPSQTNYTDDMQSSNQAIEHGVSYEYAVASKNVFDATGFVGESKIASSKPRPTKLSNLSASTNASSIEVSYDLGSEPDLTTVVVERKWPFEKNYTEIAQVRASSGKVQDSELYPYASPSYRLKVIDSDGLNSDSAELLDVDNPQALSLSVAEDGLLRKIVLSWEVTPADVAYRLQRSATSSSSWETIANLPASQTRFTDSKGLLDERQYSYRMTVIKQTEIGENVLGTSNEVQASTKALPIAPSLKATSGEVQKVTLSWPTLADSDVGGYNVYRVLESGELDKLDTLKANEDSYVDDGGFFSDLENGTEYTYRLAAFNTFKVEGPLGQEVNATTKAVPSQVQGLSAELSGLVANLAWQSAPEGDIREYEILRGSNCSSRMSKVASVSSSTSTYADNSIKNGRSYCYKVRAIDQTDLEGIESSGASVDVPEES